MPSQQIQPKSSGAAPTSRDLKFLNPSELPRTRVLAEAQGAIFSFGFATLENYKSAQELTSKARQIAAGSLEQQKSIFQKRWKDVLARVSKVLGHIDPLALEQELIAALRESTAPRPQRLQELLARAPGGSQKRRAQFDCALLRYYDHQRHVSAFFKTIGVAADIADNLSWILRARYIPGGSASASLFTRQFSDSLFTVMTPELMTLDPLVRGTLVAKPEELLASRPEAGVPEVDLCELAVRILKRFNRAEAAIRDTFASYLRPKTVGPKAQAK